MLNPENLRYVDMSDATGTPGAFALWNVDLNEFMEDLNLAQCWNNLQEIECQRPAMPAETFNRIKLLVESNK